MVSCRSPVNISAEMIKKSGHPLGEGCCNKKGSSQSKPPRSLLLGHPSHAYANHGRRAVQPWLNTDGHKDQQIRRGGPLDRSITGVPVPLPDISGRHGVSIFKVWRRKRTGALLEPEMPWHYRATEH